MNELIQELHDIEMIKQLKHRYFRAIDMADHGLLDSVFTDDIKVDYRGGTYVWEASGKKEIIQSLKYSFHSETAAMHTCLLYTSPSPRDLTTSRMPSSA